MVGLSIKFLMRDPLWSVSHVCGICCPTFVLHVSRAIVKCVTGCAGLQNSQRWELNRGLINEYLHLFPLSHLSPCENQENTFDRVTIANLKACNESTLDKHPLHNRRLSMCSQEIKNTLERV